MDGLFFKSSNSPDKGKGGRNATKKKVYMKTNMDEEEDNEGLIDNGNDTLLAIPDFKKKVKNSG